MVRLRGLDAPYGYGYPEPEGLGTSIIVLTRSRVTRKHPRLRSCKGTVFAGSISTFRLFFLELKINAGTRTPWN